MVVILIVMSRETYVEKEPAKYFQGEDLPVRSKKIVHLVTYPNFLSSNDDHSQDRPFTNTSPDRKKKLFNPNQFNHAKGFIPPYNDFKPDSKKISVKDGHQALSTNNPLVFNPRDEGPGVRSEIKRVATRNKSNLSGATAQPTVNEPIRLSKRQHSGKYTDSSSMKLSLSYVS